MLVLCRRALGVGPDQSEKQIAQSELIVAASEEMQG
jgi:hypothetical protein